MGKPLIEHYRYLTMADEVINERKETSDFLRFAKQFQPRYEDEKRNYDYERFFAERQIANSTTSRLCSCGVSHTKECPQRTIISD